MPRDGGRLRAVDPAGRPGSRAGTALRYLAQHLRLPAAAGGDQEFTPEHYVVLIQYGGNVQVRSLPETAASRVAMDLTVKRAGRARTWTEQTEQTDPDGHYSGSTYHGGIQMLLTTADRMAGQ